MRNTNKHKHNNTNTTTQTQQQEEEEEEAEAEQQGLVRLERALNTCIEEGTAPSDELIQSALQLKYAIARTVTQECSSSASSPSSTL